MKQVLLFFILSYFGNSLFGQYSDLKEYSLKGNIKSIHNAVYVKWKRTGGKLEMDSTENLLYHRTMHFNPSGQMDTISTFSFEGNDTINKSMSVFDFENDRNTGGREYDSTNLVTKIFKREWIDEHAYKLIATDVNGDKEYETTSWLSKNFQDSVGFTIVYKDGKVVDHEKYVNRFDYSKRVIGFDYYDAFNKPTHSQVVEYLEFDEKGNWTLSILRNASTGEFVKRTVRTIEYY